MPGYKTDDDEREKEDTNFEIVGPGRFPMLTRGFLEKMPKERAPWFSGKIRHIRWKIVVRFERRLAESFGSQSIWLAGDAAHLAGPVGVQSMNIGMREAVDLTRTMEEVLRNTAPRELLNRYNADRVAEWRFMLGSEGFLKASDKTDRWVSGIADRLLPCLPASGNDLAELASQLHLEMPRLRASDSGTR